MGIIKQITNALGAIIGSYFSSDMDVMSSEARRIISNEEDQRKYLEAVKKLKDTENQTETITLSTKETITLVS